MLALEKKSGGYRPIAVGCTLRRLVAKCANTFAQKKLANYFCPIQVGIAVSGGCEAAMHATRRFLESMPNDEVLVKIDFSNAFNTIRRSNSVMQLMATHLSCSLENIQSVLMKESSRGSLCCSDRFFGLF